MERTGISAEERTGLAVAVVLHLALFAMLIVQGLFPAPVIDPPQRMTVSLAEDVGMEATAPDPVTESRASTAPTLDINPAPAPAQDQPAPPQITRPTPPQVQSPVPSPNARADTSPRRRPDPPRTQSPAQRSEAQPQRSQSQPQSSQRSGGSRLSDNFLEGSGSSTTTDETRVPASQIGASAKASLFQAVARQLRPHWRPVDGADREKLVSRIRFRLNPDGTLAGAPSLVGQRGETEANRAQAPRHAENAIRAVQLAAPFDLPPEYYEAWKTVTVDFDWNLSR
ncbi:energy transducer TonB [Qipengyuania sp. Mu-71]|jgi:outer membrane biosynthesis protein TonB|uniref:energy transducer TonB n=1 Tax=Qipengyuania sp. Mu-71 TaxID=3121477 RepID=UPI002FE4303C